MENVETVSEFRKISKGLGYICGIMAILWAADIFFAPYWGVFPASILEFFFRGTLHQFFSYFNWLQKVVVLSSTLVHLLFFAYAYVGVFQKAISKYFSLVLLGLSTILLLDGFRLLLIMMDVPYFIVSILIFVVSVFVVVQSFSKPHAKVDYSQFIKGSNQTMEYSQQAQQFLLMNANKFESSDYLILQQALANISPEKMSLVYATELKDPQMILICSLLLGGTGIDRFMIGDIGLGILKLLTIGGLGIWTIIDCFLTYRKARKVNFERIMAIIAM